MKKLLLGLGREVTFIFSGFFLILVILTLTIVIPEIQKHIEDNHQIKIEKELALEAELFKRFVEENVRQIKDLATYPVVTNAVMLAEKSNPVLIDLFDNALIDGVKPALVLQDISGGIVLSNTKNANAVYSEDANWFNQILEGEINYQLEILSQNEKMVFYKISVPVVYAKNVEGVLSAEIATDLDAIFFTAEFNDVAFKLKQGEIVVRTDDTKIKIPRVNSVFLKEQNLDFTFITDDTELVDQLHSLRSSILIVLLIAFAGSFFILFVLYFKTENVVDSIDSKGARFRKYIPALIIITIGVLTSLVASLYIFENQKRKSNELNISIGQSAMSKFKFFVSEKESTLRILQSFFEASENLERARFDLFAGEILKRQDEDDKIFWVTAKAKKNAQPIKEPSSLAQRSTNQYKFTVKSIVSNTLPTSSDTQNLNLDGDCLSDLQKRISSKAVAAIPQYCVTGNIEDNGHSLYMSLPVANPHQNEKDRLQGKIDFVILAVSIQRLFEFAFNDFSKVEFLHIRSNKFNGDKSQTLFSYPAEDVPYNSTTHFTRKLELFEQNWEMSAGFTKNNISQQILLSVLSIFIIGSAISIFIGYLLVQQILRREIVERHVMERTAELKLIYDMVENATDIFTLIDISTTPNDRTTGTIKYVNRAFTKTTGYSRGEAVGQNSNLLHGPKTDENIRLAIRNATQSGDTAGGRQTKYKKDGTEYVVETNGTPIFDLSGKVTGIGVIERDLSPRIQAEAQREELISRLVDSNEELERFAYICSHDLQEPLRMVGSFAEKLSHHFDAKEYEDPRAQKYLRFLTDGATRSQALIADILEYSKIQSDTRASNEVDINECINVISINMKESDTIAPKITHSDLPSVWGNKTQLFQLFQNLINNGLKYQDGKTTPHVHIDAEELEGVWQFSVSDNGIGISEKHLAKIFDIFQRLHRREDYPGTGIGLAICKKVVQHHGGEIWAESIIGSGSTFYLTIAKEQYQE